MPSASGTGRRAWSEMRSSSATMVARWGRSTKAHQVSSVVTTGIGEPASAIADFAASHGCTQIVIGTRGHSGLTGTLLGSVAMKLVHHAKVPVLLVR